MLTRADFTTPDWNVMQRSVIGSATYISQADHEGIFDNFKEMASVKDVLRLQIGHSKSSMLADFVQYPVKGDVLKKLKGKNSKIETVVMQDIENTVKLLFEKDKTELANYRDLILNVIAVVADKNDGVSNEESEAFMKIHDQVMRDPVYVEDDNPYS